MALVRRLPWAQPRMFGPASCAAATCLGHGHKQRLHTARTNFLRAPFRTFSKELDMGTQGVAGSGPQPGVVPVGDTRVETKAPEAGVCTHDGEAPAAKFVSAAAADLPLTLCRAWVKTRRIHDPGDSEGRMPGAEKVAMSIDLSPLHLSVLEQAVARGVAGPRFHPASNVLTLSLAEHTTAGANLEELYAQTRQLVGEVRRLALEIASDSDLEPELVIAQLGKY